eukprot:jgi/Mesen1/1678/ME000137S00593
MAKMYTMGTIMHWTSNRMKGTHMATLRSCHIITIVQTTTPRMRLQATTRSAMPQYAMWKVRKRMPVCWRRVVLPVASKALGADGTMKRQMAAQLNDASQYQFCTQQPGTGVRRPQPGTGQSGYVSNSRHASNATTTTGSTRITSTSRLSRLEMRNTAPVPTHWAEFLASLYMLGRAVLEGPFRDGGQFWEDWRFNVMLSLT